MLTKNNLILLAITIFGFLLSGFLIYQGLSSSNFNFSDSKVENSSQNQVLGSREILEASVSAEIGIKALVTRVIDGDTIEVEIDKGLKKMRYIGINTPETVDPRKKVECFGKEASYENKRLVEGKIIYFQKDVSTTDRFDRLLGFVYLPLTDGEILFVNDYLVRQGFAYSFSYPPDIKYSEKFRQAENEARENLRGLWGKCN